MNDPHVAALFYWLEHDDYLDYDKAPPLEGENNLLHFSLDKRRLTITPKDHYQNEYEAIEALEGFVRSWEFEATVESGRGQLSFRYERPEIVDRSPDQGPAGHVRASARPIHFSVRVTEAQGHVSRGRYPRPPLGLKTNPDNDVAQKILSRLERYHQRRETLGTAAYFAVTALEDGAQGPETDDRKRAAHYYRISRKVLAKVATLGDGKGGSEARKSKGSGSEYTEDEKRFLVAAVQAFTRRAAEIGENPPARFEIITLKTLEEEANLT